jgi:hypothetical protein
VRNKSRLRSGASNPDQLVGDYSNPILKPEAAEVVKKFGDISLSGRAFPDPDSQCLQNPLPYIFWNFNVRLLQQPDKVTIIYQHDDDFRQVRLNQPHPATVIPSVHGDSVGHYEGDTLVIDTVGIKVGPYRMIDRFGTPYSQALHVVSATVSLTTRPPRKRSVGSQRNGRPSAPPSIATIGARACSSNSRWRMKASSPCPGRRQLHMAATRIRNGRNVSAPKMCNTSTMDTSFPTRTRMCQLPTSRTSEWRRWKFRPKIAEELPRGQTVALQRVVAPGGRANLLAGLRW